MHVYHQDYNNKTLHQSCQGSQQPTKFNSQQFKKQSHDGEETTPIVNWDCSPASEDTEEST